MDHLPIPVDAKKPEVQFYALRRRYTPNDFYRIPKDLRWKDPEWEDGDFMTLIEQGLWSGMMKSDAEEFLQSWLFFGLLARVLGIDISYEDFYDVESDILQTRRLNSAIQSWKERECQSDREIDQQKRKDRWLAGDRALAFARKFVSTHLSCGSLNEDSHDGYGSRTVDHTKSPRHVHHRVDTRLTLSLAILGETLEQSRKDLALQLQGNSLRSGEFDTKPASWGYSRFCRQLMQDNGWCPQQIFFLESTMPNISAVYYACTMKRHNRPVGHGNCNAFECRAQKTELTAIHVDGCNSCTSLGFSDDELCKIVDSGKTPLVTFDASGRLQYRVYDLQKCELPFGAISHSWKDKIFDAGKDTGGRNNGRMHRCQIERVQKTFNKLTASDLTSASANTPFWVDVLCMPRGHSSLGKAINQLGNVYTKASAVLIWERDLLLRRITPNHPLEISVRLRMSDWSQRLWTLQEAVLGRRVFIQFADGTVATSWLDKARARIRTDSNSEAHYLWQSCSPFSEGIQRLRLRQGDLAMAAFAAIQHRRSTDGDGDEPAVLSHILRLDASPILAIPRRLPRQRIAAFLALLDATPTLGVPPALAFMHTGIASVPGDAWAPASWMRYSGPLPVLDKKLQRYPTRLLRHGLEISAPGVRLRGLRPLRLDGHCFCIPITGGLWFKVTLQGGSLDETVTPQTARDKELCLIMSSAIPGNDWEVGLLVQSEGFLARGEVRCVKTLGQIRYCLETNPNIVRRIFNQSLGADGEVWTGELIGETQRWCIMGPIDTHERELSVGSHLLTIEAATEERYAC